MMGFLPHESQSRPVAQATGTITNCADSTVKVASSLVPPSCLMYRAVTGRMGALARWKRLTAMRRNRTERSRRIVPHFTCG